MNSVDSNSARSFGRSDPTVLPGARSRVRPSVFHFRDVSFVLIQFWLRLPAARAPRRTGGPGNCEKRRRYRHHGRQFIPVTNITTPSCRRRPHSNISSGRCVVRNEHRTNNKQYTRNCALPSNVIIFVYAKS